VSWLLSALALDDAQARAPFQKHSAARQVDPHPFRAERTERDLAIDFPGASHLAFAQPHENIARLESVTVGRPEFERTFNRDDFLFKVIKPAIGDDERETILQFQLSGQIFKLDDRSR
jgi:hypothetical protein